MTAQGWYAPQMAYAIPGYGKTDINKAGKNDPLTLDSATIRPYVVTA